MSDQGLETGKKIIETAKEIASEAKRELGGPNTALASVLLAARLLAAELGDERANRIAAAVDQLEASAVETQRSQS